MGIDVGATLGLASFPPKHTWSNYQDYVDGDFVLITSRKLKAALFWQLGRIVRWNASCDMYDVYVEAVGKQLFLLHKTELMLAVNA